MKHMVQIKVTQHEGLEMEARQGGPGPVIGRIIERFRPNTVVLSQNEIHPKARIKTLGQL